MTDLDSQNIPENLNIWPLVFKQRNWILSLDTNFIIPTSLQPDSVNLWYFKLCLSWISEFTVRNRVRVWNERSVSSKGVFAKNKRGIKLKKKKGKKKKVGFDHYKSSGITQLSEYKWAQRSWALSVFKNVLLYTRSSDFIFRI